MLALLPLSGTEMSFLGILAHGLTNLPLEQGKVLAVDKNSLVGGGIEEKRTVSI